MFCLRLMAPVPLVGTVRCVCGQTGHSVDLGYHWLAACEKVSLSTAQHNAAVGVLQTMATRAGWETMESGSANWFRGKADIRPYDLLVPKDPAESWIG